MNFDKEDAIVVMSQKMSHAHYFSGAFIVVEIDFADKKKRFNSIAQSV